MRKTRIAINGFGRIGRLFFRALQEKNMLNKTVEVVVVNDLVSAENLAYLMKYDSVHGKAKQEIKAISENEISVDGNIIKTISMRVNPDVLPWKNYDIDIVIECTGAFTKKEDSYGHIKAGAKKVIISAPSDDDTKTIVIGVNDNTYNNEEIVSNASCTTNCLTPLCYVLLKEGLGIEEGMMMTAHSYTASQSLIDQPAKKQFRDGRAAAINLIPATTGATKAVQLVLPELKGKINGMAIRVPTADVSVVDFTFKTSRDTSIEEINSLVKKASETYLKGILEYTDEDLVSTDFIHNEHSTIYDSKASMQLNSRFFKLIAWYDNEWGYSNRLVDLLAKMSSNV